MLAYLSGEKISYAPRSSWRRMRSCPHAEQRQHRSRTCTRTWVREGVCGTRNIPRPEAGQRETRVPRVYYATLILWSIGMGIPPHCPGVACLLRAKRKGRVQRCGILDGCVPAVRLGSAGSLEPRACKREMTRGRRVRLVGVARAEGRHAAVAAQARRKVRAAAPSE